MGVDVLAMQAVGHTTPPGSTSAVATRISTTAGADFGESLAGAVQPPAPPASHTVRQGDNLSGIVRNHTRALGRTLSNAEVWQGVLDVARANGLANPDYIVPGQAIDLSVLSPVTAPAPTPVPAPAVTTAPPLRSSAATVSAEKPAATETVAPEAAAPTPAASASPEPLAVVTHPEPGVSALALFPMTGHAPPAITTPAERATAQVLRRPATQRTGGIGGAPYVRTRRDELEVFQLTAGVSYRKPDDVGMTAITEERSTAKASIVQPWAPLLGGAARLTSDYGRRADPFTGVPDFHKGIDLAAKMGTHIHPLREGTVSFSGWQSGYGKVVIVRHDDGLETVYGHNASNRVRKGQRVGPEDVLALVGSTGRSTGPHLHFEVRENGRAVNPMPHLGQTPPATRIARN
jgi:murein DD-endopeptidase MepM/ murein hydrolase activator NlpD